MRIRSLGAARVLVVVAAAGLAGLGAAGCTGTAASSAPQSAGSTSAAANRPAPSTTSTAPAKAATVQALKFPNTSTTVMFAGYDAKNHMPKFQKVVQNPTASSADLIPDPKDPAIHELPLAPGTDVKAMDNGDFPFETCPPTNCTSDDVIQSVMSHTTLWAHIHVNAADQIDVVNQIAY